MSLDYLLASSSKSNMFYIILVFMSIWLSSNLFILSKCLVCMNFKNYIANLANYSLLSSKDVNYKIKKKKTIRLAL